MFVSGDVAARLFQRSTACVRVGAVGPNAQHVLHDMNLGSRSLLIQISEPPQNGQGRGGCEDMGSTLSPSVSDTSVSPHVLAHQGTPATFRGLAPVFSKPVRPVQRVQFGVYPLKEALYFVALTGAGTFFQAADQILLVCQQRRNVRHRRRPIVSF